MMSWILAGLLAGLMIDYVRLALRLTSAERHAAQMRGIARHLLKVDGEDFEASIDRMVERLK